LKKLKAPYYINVWNVESSASQNDLKSIYKDVNVQKIIKNLHKQGNFDFVFENQLDAVKFIKKGTGVALLCSNSMAGAFICDLAIEIKTTLINKNLSVRARILSILTCK